MIELPKQAGTYALFLRLKSAQRLNVGRLGRFELLPGTYIYLGSALGPGGLQARLGRHLDGRGSSHWHIDALRAVASPFGAIYTLSDERLECDWSQRLLALPNASIPARGFGASDCRRGCCSHLIAFPGGEVSFTSILSALKSVCAGSNLHSLNV